MAENSERNLQERLRYIRGGRYSTLTKVAALEVPLRPYRCDFQFPHAVLALEALLSLRVDERATES